MSHDLVILEESQKWVRLVTLNRPEKRNALSIELRFALADIFNSLATDATCHAVVLTGQGDHFCGGMDFTEFGGSRENKLKLLHSTQSLFASLLQFPKPIVGGIRGAAVGGGFTLALCCDVRIASANAYFGFLEVKLGIPAPYEIIRVYANESKAREWCQTGRRIEAREARDEGIIRGVVKAERLLEECELEAERLGERSMPAALNSAFELQMNRFARALFPEGVGIP